MGRNMLGQTDIEMDKDMEGKAAGRSTNELIER